MANALLAKLGDKIGFSDSGSEDEDEESEEETAVVAAGGGGGSSKEDITTFVRNSVTQMVGAGGELENDSPLMMVSGLNSMSSAMLQEVLQSEFAISLPVTLAFDYPSVNGIANFIHEQQGGSAGAAKVP